jgi:hypothetical protein
VVTRAVSAGKDWLTPLAVLVPILGAPALAILFGAGGRQAFRLLVLFGVLALVAVVGYFTYGVLTSVLAAVLTWLLAVFSFVVFWEIDINTSLCGKNIAAGWGWLAPTIGGLTFFAVGGWALETRRGKWGVPLGYAAGFVALMVLLLAVPGTTGTCET